MIFQSNEIISHYSDLPLLKAYHARRTPFRREVQPHCHSAFEMSVVVTGSGVYTVGERRYLFHPGDIFLFSTNEPHCMTEVFAGADLHLINLQFEPRFIWLPGSDAFDLRYLDVFFHRSERFCHQLQHSDPRSAPIRSLLEQLDLEFRRKHACYELMVKNLLLTALVHVLRNYQEYFLGAPLPHTARTVRRLEQVMQYIDEHLTEPLTLAQLADTAHMSRSHFSALFRELNGLSAGAYIIGKRVALAAHLLRSTDRPVMEIALACGFNTAANFNHAFRRQTGVPPLVYRKNARP